MRDSKGGMEAKEKIKNISLIKEGLGLITKQVKREIPTIANFSFKINCLNDAQKV